ncbi:hypothetical protein J3E68DRAFT_211735 [Trichoderma sp. SZMC 28012]
MKIESSGRLSACGVSRWPTGTRCGASPGRAEYIGELAFYPRLVWLLGFCPALVASLALSIRFPICWRRVIVELQAGPMHWQGTRTVLYTSVAVPAQCLHASSAASNRTDRIGGDENFFHHGSGLAIGAATQSCWRRRLGRRRQPHCASWSSRQGHWPATRFRHAGIELLPLLRRCSRALGPSARKKECIPAAGRWVAPNGKPAGHPGTRRRDDSSGQQGGCNCPCTNPV